MWYAARLLLACGIVSFAAEICPMDEHQICNPGHAKHACTCAMVQSHESPPPEKSCSRVAEPDEEGKLPVVSVTFALGSGDEGDNKEWPQKEFIDSIHSSLRVSKDSIVVLRVNCQGTDDKLTVQFGVLKKNANTTLPYDEEDFVDAVNLAQRMNAMGHLNRIADLEVEKIEAEDELIDIEEGYDNTDLVILTIGSGVVFGLLFILGLCTVCRKKEYEDDLQKV